MQGSNGVIMDKVLYPADHDDNLGRATSQGRSFAKDIAELALFLELTEQGSSHHFDAAAAEVAAERRISASTLKRCASEARALIAYAHESGALQQIRARAEGGEWALRQDLSAWLDEISLPAILKQRALRLNRRRGGRPSTCTRTLRAVEELVEFARAGHAGAADELRSIRALIAET
jgi:hypothetical protein